MKRLDLIAVALLAGAVLMVMPTAAQRNAQLSPRQTDTINGRSAMAGEVLVSKTEISFTYTQTPKEGQPYNLYHGTLEARPVTATTSKIVYTLFFDNSMLPNDAARAADRARRTERFTQALQNMKILAEGGRLPPAPAGGGTTAGGAPPR